MRHLMLVMLVGMAQLAIGQKYFSKTGKISFVSDAPMEKIEAMNTSASTVLDAATGNMEWAVLIQGFKFDKALMQEHFNENYVESHKFPKAEFKGQIVNNGEVNYNKDGTYTATVKGKLTIHGETKDVETVGTIVVKGGKIDTDASFTVELADYKIEVPKIVKDNISKTISITVDCVLDPLKS